MEGRSLDSKDAYPIALIFFEQPEVYGDHNKRNISALYIRDFTRSYCIRRENFLITCPRGEDTNYDDGNTT